MKRTNLNIIWGIVLIAVGVLALLQTLDFIQSGWEAVWAIVFGVAGLAFLWQFVSDPPGSWWAAIPGCTLLGLAFVMGVVTLGGADIAGPWLGALFMGSISAAFWLTYLVHRDFWWAIIPGGVLLSVAAVALFATWWQSEVLGAVLFFGMGLTFGLVSTVPTPQGRLTWALIPAGVFGVLGLAVLLAFNSAVNYIWALALIAAGIYLLFRQRGGGEMTRRG